VEGGNFSDAAIKRYRRYSRRNANVTFLAKWKYFYMTVPYASETWSLSLFLSLSLALRYEQRLRASENDALRNMLQKCMQYLKIETTL
jgi:hypothetical protein